MKSIRQESITAELDRRVGRHLAVIRRQRPGITFDLAYDVAWRRVGRDIGMSRIEIARAAAAYRDYCRAPQSRSKNRKNRGTEVPAEERDERS